MCCAFDLQTKFKNSILHAGFVEELILEDSLTFFGALFAGILSFLSPCVLPLVPPYLCYIAGVSLDDLKQGGAASTKNKAVVPAIFFVLGFSVVFISLGASASYIGGLVSEYFDILSKIAGAIIILMGLHFMGVFRLAFLYREARYQYEAKNINLFGAFLVGVAFAFGWTPCIGPVLAAILAVAAREESLASGAYLLSVYSLGLGLPFILAAWAINPFLSFAQRFNKHLGLIEKIMGALLVLTGILFLTGAFAHVAYWILEKFPVLGTIG